MNWGRSLSTLVVAVALGLGPGCIGKARYEDALATSASLEQQLEDLQGELARLRVELAARIADLGQARGHASELETLVSALEQRNTQLRGNLVDLGARLAEVKARNAAEQASKAELAELLATLQSQSAATVAEVEAARDRIAELDAARGAAEAEAERLRAEKERLAAKTQAYGDLLAALEGEIAAGQVKITELSGRLVVNMSNAILFDSAKYGLKPEGQAALVKVAGVLAGVTDRTIQVEGHTDDDAVRAGAQFADNWALSALRASTVVTLLVGSGVAPGNIAALGFGEHHPVADNATAEGKAANRRTEIVLVPKLK